MKDRSVLNENLPFGVNAVSTGRFSLSVAQKETSNGSDSRFQKKEMSSVITDIFWFLAAGLRKLLVDGCSRCFKARKEPGNGDIPMEDVPNFRNSFSQTQRKDTSLVKETLKEKGKRVQKL